MAEAAPVSVACKTVKDAPADAFIAAFAAHLKQTNKVRDARG
jgi:ribosomal protein S19E (S16A)